VRTVIKHVTKRLRQHWPNTRIVWRGDGHYGRVRLKLYFFARSVRNLLFPSKSSSAPSKSSCRSLAGSLGRPRRVKIEP
jgi:hypothetical protein